MYWILHANELINLEKAILIKKNSEPGTAFEFNINISYSNTKDIKMGFKNKKSRDTQHQKIIHALRNLDTSD